MRNKIILGVLATVVLAVSACSGSSDTESSPTTASVEATTTSVKVLTGSHQKCYGNSVLVDDDNDGWGSCKAPETTVAPTATPTTTIDSVISEGTYIVGDDIQPGVYRVAGYWSRLDASQEVIDNDGVYEGGVGLMRVTETDAYVEISGAALAIEDSRPLDVFAEGFTEGTYLVGFDIQPGRYRITATSSRDAYYSRLDYDGEIIENDLSDGSVIAIISDQDWAFQFSGTIESI